jgi:DNA-binding ferritin-like protein (Dps family)
MNMLDEKGIPYEQWPEKIVVDITGLDQMIMLELMQHLEMKGVEYAVDENMMYVMPKMIEEEMFETVMIDDRAGNEALGLEIELFARKYIPEYDDAFGKFMYHAELVKNGHYDIHMQDIEMVAEPYRTILQNMIKKGGM